MQDKLDEEISTSEEDKQFVTFLLNGFHIKTSVEALENFKDKIKGKVGTEEKMLAWVQGKMRLNNSSKPAKEGTFDIASSRFLEHIFKTQIKDARKQTKLTDTVIIGAEGSYGNHARCQRCHKPCSKHGITGSHTCRNFQAATRSRGRPKKGD